MGWSNINTGIVLGVEPPDLGSADGDHKDVDTAPIDHRDLDLRSEGCGRNMEPLGHDKETVGRDELLALILVKRALNSALGTRLKRMATMERFIQRKNIEHYRKALESGQLDELQRQMIAKLLAEEEAKRGNIDNIKLETGGFAWRGRIFHHCLAARVSH
jgi:hypothetical protein